MEALIVITLLAVATGLTIVMVLVVPLPGTHHPKSVEVEPATDSKHAIEPPEWIAPSIYRTRSTLEFRIADYPTDNFAVGTEMANRGQR